jgi:hypothetical protein
MSDQLNEILTNKTIPPENLEIYKNGKWQPLQSQPLQEGVKELTQKELIEQRKTNIMMGIEEILPSLKKHEPDLKKSMVRDEDVKFLEGVKKSLETNKQVSEADLKTAMETLGRYGKKEAFGAIAGIETDEQGNLKFNPVKAAVGVGAMKATKKLTPSEIKKQSINIAKKAKGKLPISQTKKIVREITGQTEQIFQTTEEKMLRLKMRTAEIYSKIGARAGKTSMIALQRAARKYVSDLPKQQQDKIFRQVSFSEVTSKSKLKKVLDKIDTLRTKFNNQTARLEVIRELKPLQKIAREKGILGKINMKARKELGLTSKTYKTAAKEKLLKYKQIIKDELDTTPKKIDVSNVNWNKVAKESGVGSSKGKTITQKVGEGIESAIGIVSTNIRKYGGDKLFSAIRERQFDINKFGKQYADKIKGFQKGISKMKGKWFGGKSNYENMAHALFNQDFERAREIARKYKFEPELDNVISVLDDIYNRSKEVGLKVGQLKNYFPRIVKDYNGLFAEYNKKFGQEGRSYFDKILSKYANEKGRRLGELTMEERAEVLTNALRGYGAGKINVGTVNKARQFKELPVEFLKYYHTPEDALTMYISKMNDRITLKKLFGLDGNEQDSIGALVDKLDITPNAMIRLKENLSAILSPQGQENWVLNKIRKSATLTLLSNVASTLFQIADIGVNAYKHGSLRALASLIRKKPFKRDELFTEIAHEFSDSNVIKNTLKAVGFDRLDRLNNEAFMANAFREAVRYVRNGKGSGFNKVKEYADVVFRGDESKIAKFLDDVKNKRVTDETSLYVFNKVLDVQPRALIEMPEAYANHPNARMFYSMKSYGLKILDVYRNDVIREKKTLTKAKNAIRLTAILTLSGATGSQIRDWYNGKDTKFSDNVLNNFFQIAMFSTYDAANIQRDGLGSALLQKGLPPSRWVNDISQDILSVGDGNGLKSVRNIPIIGTELYNRIGRGKDTIAKASDTTASHYERINKMLVADQKKALIELKKTQPRKYTAVVKQMKWDRMGVTDKEKKFAKLGVEDGERAEAIIEYLQKQKDWKTAYGRLRKAGIITDDVRKQLRPELKLLMNK